MAFSAPYGADLYHPLFEGPLVDRRAQQEVIQAAIEQGQGKLNWAHLRLGQLVAERFFHTVLTTNFDQLALQALIRCGVLPAVADGLEALTRLSPNPPWPQLVHLHGSRHSYELLNSRADVDAVARNVVSSTVLPGFLSQARFLLVVGYSASDNGLRQLLSQAMRAFPDLPVFWALHGVTLPPRVAALHADHAGCIRLLRHQDADALFDGLAQAAGLGRPPWAEDPIHMLQEEARRIAPPEALEAAGRVVADHGAELAVLAECLGRHRAAATVPKKQERRLDDLLLAGEFDAAQALLRQAGTSGTAEDWMRLAEAAADSVLDHYKLAAAEAVEAALRTALEDKDVEAPERFGIRRLWSVGDALRLVGRHDAAALAFRRMEVEARALGEEGERDRSVSLNKLGDIARDGGDRAGAAKLYEESLGIRRRLAERLGTPEAERDLSVSLDMLGNIARDGGDRAGAAKLYEESLGIRRRLAERLGMPEAWIDLGLSAGRAAQTATDPTVKTAFLVEARAALAKGEGSTPPSRMAALQAWIAALEGPGALPSPPQV